MVRSGNNVKGTKYNSAGCAALNISELTVAVKSPRKYPNREQWKYVRREL